MPPLRIIRLHFCLAALEVHGAIRTGSHRGGDDVFFHRSQRAQQLIFFTVADLECVEGGHQIADLERRILRR